MASASSRLQTHLLQSRVFTESFRRTLVTVTSASKRRFCKSSETVLTRDISNTKQCSCSRKAVNADCPSLQQRSYSDQTKHKHNDIKPFEIVKPEIDTLCQDINKTFDTRSDELRQISQYYFDGQGKTFRPMVVMMMSKALNQHTSQTERLLPSQQKVAMIAEMIHTASLIHDDVIDGATTRRGKPTVDKKWGEKKAIATGDYILSVSSIQLAQIRNKDVVQILSQVIDDLVKGEFMQLGSNEDTTNRFNHYLKKTYKKTASLIANSCKAVAVLGNCDTDIVDLAYQYGSHIGIAFQLVDDLLDFTSCDSILGKPTAADLKLGLATAPVLFAAQEYEELSPMIMRRFSYHGDVERARELVAESDGVEKTRILAERHSTEALQLLSRLTPSVPCDGLKHIGHMVISRHK